MIPRALVYLGAADSAGVPRWNGAPLVPETRLPLVRTRSPWRESRPIERVLLGSHGQRADLRIEAPGVEAEHIRFYLSKASLEVNDLRAIVEDGVWVNDSLVDDEWRPLSPGDEVRLAGLRFRFEVGEAAAD